MTLTIEIPTEAEAGLTQAARRQGQTPVEAAAALTQLFAPAPPERDLADEEDQARRHAVAEAFLKQAEVIVPEPFDSPIRRAYRENPVGETIAEKFRRQGFTLQGRS